MDNPFLLRVIVQSHNSEKFEVWHAGTLLSGRVSMSPHWGTGRSLRGVGVAPTCSLSSVSDRFVFTEFTEAVSDNTEGISKHRLSTYNNNAHYLNYNFSLGFWFHYLMNMRFKIIQNCAISATLW